MSESSGVGGTAGAMILEEPEERGRAGSHQQGAARGPGLLRCGPCALWPRQQTWLCMVPLFIGFIGLGLSLMLLKWIVVGSVRDYVPTDLVNPNAKGMGQDPIFLSKPSTFPKSFDTTTTTTAGTRVVSATAVPSSSTTVVNVGGRGRTRVSSTTSRTTMPGRQGTQRTQSTTMRHGPHPPLLTTTTAAVSTKANQGTSTSSSKTSNPTVLHDSTQLWTHDHNTKLLVVTPTPTHNRGTTPSPTLPPLRSEHFKQCHEKDLTYCLNDGECFVIETLSGSHKHCRCKEGFQGIRCDQFLPKTDSILSDPTEHLGIEFMESKAIYKRQVLSITCITTGISLLGTVCMALYCRNKRRREKLQVHLKEGHNLKNYLVNDPNHKLCLRSLQPQHYCRGSSLNQAHIGVKSQPGFSEGTRAPFTQSKDPKRNPTCGESLSIGSEKTTVNCKMPPMTNGLLNPALEEKGHPPSTYQYLQEPEFADREVESVKGHNIRPKSYQRQSSLISVKSGGGTKMESQSACQSACQLERGACMLNEASCSSSSSSSSPSLCPHHLFFTSTVPIIPSVLRNEDEAFCMQSSYHAADTEQRISSPSGPSSSSSSSASSSSSSQPQHGPITQVTDQYPPVPPPTSTMSSSSLSTTHHPRQHTQMALLLDEAQEQLHALVHATQHRKHSEVASTSTAPSWPRETVCILLGGGASAGGVASNGPTETQLLNSRDMLMSKDSTQCCK